MQSRRVFCSANDLDIETNREFGRVEKLISRERLTGQNRGREGEERPIVLPSSTVSLQPVHDGGRDQYVALGRTFVKK